jgi:hypothetical protein
MIVPFALPHIPFIGTGPHHTVMVIFPIVIHPGQVHDILYDIVDVSAGVIYTPHVADTPQLFVQLVAPIDDHVMSDVPLYATEVGDAESEIVGARGGSTPLSITMILTVAHVLTALPSDTVNLKLSDPVYPRAGRYVMTPVEESVS